MEKKPLDLISNCSFLVQGRKKFVKRILQPIRCHLAGSEINFLGRSQLVTEILFLIKKVVAKKGQFLKIKN